MNFLNFVDFANPWWLLLLPLLPVPLFLFRNKGHLGFSDHRLLPQQRLSRWLPLFPRLLTMASLAFLLVALARPQVAGPPTTRTIIGRDIEIAVDISFSMSAEFKGELKPEAPIPGLDLPPTIDTRGKPQIKRWAPKVEDDGKVKRCDAAQHAVLQFIANRWRAQAGDRVGLILFDDRPRYGWPLTEDLRMIYRKGQFMQHGLGGGTNFGETPPGPIDLAEEHFKELGQSQTRVLIMVTDGEDELSSWAMDRLSQIIQKNNIRLYVVGVGETLAKKDVAIIRLAERNGGKVYRVEDSQAMINCFAEIDRTERSPITVAQDETRSDIFFYFAGAAAISLVLALLAGAIILNR